MMIGIRASVSPQSPAAAASFSRRLFSRSGIHEVEGPNLGSGPRARPQQRPSRPPPPQPPPVASVSSLMRPVTGRSIRVFFPSSSSPSHATLAGRRLQQQPATSPIVRHSRRRLPPDYNSDIITINDILSDGRPKADSSKNTEWVRTVGTSIQVTPNDERRVFKGKVFNDVIYGNLRSASGT